MPSHQSSVPDLDGQLSDFLAARRKHPPRGATHSDLSGGSYVIADHELPLLHRLLARSPERVDLAELPLPDCSPLLIDVDLRYLASGPDIANVRWRAIEQMLKLYNQELLSLGVPEDMLVAAVSYPQSPSETGFHIQYPNFALTERSIWYLRHPNPRLWELGRELSEQQTRIDCSIPWGRQAWYLYGSGKRGRHAYELQGVYRSTNQGSGLSEVSCQKSKEELINWLSIRSPTRPVLQTTYDCQLALDRMMATLVFPDAKGVPGKTLA